MKLGKTISNFFTLSWKKTVISLILFASFFFFRNPISSLFPGFFDLIGGYNIILMGVEILIPLYFLISIIHTLPIRKKVKIPRKKTNIFLLSWRKTGIMIIAWILAVFFHNLVYALFYGYYSRTGGDEPVFFLIATVAIPLYFLVSIVYTIFQKVRKKKWKKKLKR